MKINLNSEGHSRSLSCSGPKYEQDAAKLKFTLTSAKISFRERVELS